jgi:hypothetical protein
VQGNLLGVAVRDHGHLVVVQSLLKGNKLRDSWNEAPRGAHSLIYRERARERESGRASERASEREREREKEREALILFYINLYMYIYIYI